MIPVWAKNVSRETIDQLERYVALLEKWNKKISMVASGDNLWARHIWDSYQLVDLIPASAKTLADMGSGAGLPGIVLAIATELDITLIERDQRKSAFLNEAVRALDLKRVRVLAKPIEEVAGPFDVVTARALAPLHLLYEQSYPLLAKNSICLFPKGQNFASELGEAEKDWTFSHQLHQSKTSANSYIVSVTELHKK